MSHQFASAAASTIVVSGGALPARAKSREVNAKLLGALPAAARVLELGCGSGALASAYKRLHPHCTWHGVDIDSQLLAAAGSAFDQRSCLDLNTASLAALAGPFDLIVIGDVLQRVADPLRLLRELNALATAATALYLDVANLAQLAMIERLIEADLTPADEGPWGQADLRHFSAASIYKLLMDAGWMPTLAAACAAEPVHESIAEGAWSMAQALGVPRGTAERNLRTGRLVIQAQRCFEGAAAAPGEAARFAVVVPTTRESQLRLNVELSPGLREVGAQIVSYRKAANPAEALEQSLPHFDAEWVLYCHQDVYFPSGFGAQLNALLAGVPSEERKQVLIGFAGVAVNASADGVANAGFVIDRLQRFDNAASERAISIDELAIVVARDSVHRIDPQLGWHLWATDLCLTAICTHQVFPRIVRLPLFHNSVNDYQLPDAFYASAERLLAKHASFGPVPTLCGSIDAQFLAQRPRAQPAQSQVAERIENEHFVMVDGVDAEVAAKIAQGDHEAALAKIVAGVHQSYLKPGIAHQALYYPQLDRHIEQLAKRLGAEHPAAAPARRGQGTLLIATELYELGGHSRVLLDVSHDVVRPVVVLTDLFNTYDKHPEQLEAVTQRFKHANLIVLPPGSYWQKCGMLREVVCAMKPRDILYFGHHQDPIPYVGTLDAAAPRKILFHHADHNPSLGCTIAGLGHVDFAEPLREVCAKHLRNAPKWLPLYVPDEGVKKFPAVVGMQFSVATSGHPAKFRRTGPDALQNIVQRALQVVGGSFFHIGPLDAEWVAEIRAHLAAQGLDAGRFVHRGLVPSVWRELKALDAACYIGSAPVGGGRASIEAQGCGYPVLYFKGNEGSAVLGNFSLYAHEQLGWSTLDELQVALQALGADFAKLSAATRRFYLERYARPPFQRAMRKILAA